MSRRDFRFRPYLGQPAIWVESYGTHVLYKVLFEGVTGRDAGPPKRYYKKLR